MTEIKAGDVLKMLKSNGFKELKSRTNGDHHRFTDDKGHKVTVPFTSKKDTILQDTYKSILKQAGVK
ncbi:type II toxin-antitoxin system HicA family toxin [Xylocopilactobacillus apicola]|uniref:Toxin HicA n=1 Tax=Xylocopilactobacillus apicola TaxID=2932184 RepID=A0AAU9DDB0_9LACO|nr:hypothetical protein XA3_20010 [Xylocopilactobacillus apicola]